MLTSSAYQPGALPSGQAGSKEGKSCSFICSIHRPYGLLGTGSPGRHYGQGAQDVHLDFYAAPEFLTPPPIPTTIVPIIILTYIWPACVPPRLGRPLTPGSQWWGQVWSWTQKTDSCQQSILLYDCECEPDFLTLCAVTAWTPNHAAV